MDKNLDALESLPSVSVVIAAYNCASTIGAAIESCLVQSHPPCEVIVVNDGSTDKTAQVLATFGDRIRVIHQANAGLAGARNAGTQAARAECVVWMDADDLAMPERLRVQASVLKAFPAIGLVSTDFSAFYDSGDDVVQSHINAYYEAASRLGGVRRIYPETANLVDCGDAQGCPAVLRYGAVYEALIWGNFVHPPTVMARRSLHDRVGPFDESLRYSSDYDLLVRMASLSEFGYVDAPLLRYRLSSVQMSKAASQGKLQLETVRILGKLESMDPDLYARRYTLIQRRVAESLLSAAAAIGSSDRSRAFGLLREGLQRGFIPVMAMRAATRIALPMPLLSVISKVRRQFRPGRHPA